MMNFNDTISSEPNLNASKNPDMSEIISLKDIEDILKIDHDVFNLLINKFIDNAKAYLKETYSVIYAILDILDVNDDDEKLMDFLDENLIFANFIDSTNSKSKELTMIENSIANGEIDLSKFKHKYLWESMFNRTYNLTK